MTHPENGPIAIVLSFLALIALPAQIRAKSIPTISLALWLFATGVTRGINAIVWTDNVDIKLQIWCDITTKIAAGFPYAVPGSAFCIMRQLESISSARSLGTGIQERRKKLILEVVVCWIIPFIFMVLHYLVQGHRYDLFEGMGCLTNYYNSLPTFFLVYLPPLLYSVASLVYGLMVIHHFVGHRTKLMKHLKSRTSSISKSSYIRLLCLASVEIFWEMGANIFIIWYNMHDGMATYVSWDFVHADFSAIYQTPRFLITDDVYNALLFIWWTPAIACAAFFIFFGTGEEAMKDYRMVIRWVLVKILGQTVDRSSCFSGGSQFDTLPRSSTSRRGLTQSVSQIYNDNASKNGPKAWENEFKASNPGEPYSPTSDYAVPLYTTHIEPIAVAVLPCGDADMEGFQTNRNSPASALTDIRVAQPTPANLPTRFAYPASNGAHFIVNDGIA